MKELAPAAVMAALIFAFAASGWVVMSYFEARAFNHVTGRNVSTWDAMFVELRVQSN